MGTLTGREPSLPEHCPHKLATSCRLTASPSCCACQDKRPHAPSYSTYIDGVGLVNRGTRWQRYCWWCKEFWDNRIEATNPFMHPKDSRIPQDPPQDDFLAQWFDFHRGYKFTSDDDQDTPHLIPVTPERPWLHTPPGQLPILGSFSRQVTSRVSRPQVQNETHESLDSVIDNLIATATDESLASQIETTEATRDPRPVGSSPATAQALRQPPDYERELREAREQITRVSEKRRKLARELADADEELRTSRHRQMQLTRERRTAQHLERVFGSLEEIQQQGSSYVSPLTSMFSRAYDRYHIAEEVRAEERLSDEQTANHDQLFQQLVWRQHDRPRDVQDENEEAQMPLTTPSLDDDSIERPPPKTDEELTVKLTCKICLQQRAEVAVLPCGHLVMCSYCSEIAMPTKDDHIQPIRKNAQCPMCRKTVKRIARIYTA